MTQKSITIIGMGPRGVSVLERIAHFAKQQLSDVSLVVNLVDPGECGQGTHSAQQPAHLLTNTLANQVTLFPPDSLAVKGGGLSFGEWARHSGYRMFGNACYVTGEEGGDEIGDQHYLPRRLLGKYFTWAFDQIAESLDKKITLRHFRMRVVGMDREDGDQYRIRLQTGFHFLSDYVILTTGHGTRRPDDKDKAFDEFVAAHSINNSKLGFYRQAYPVDKLQQISPDATVAVQGFGLTAHDVVCQLTTGRGGLFDRRDGDLLYVPSGREPRILMYSRKSLPFSARPMNQKGVAERYEARFFTKDAIAALRLRAQRTRGTTQIDFVHEILPLVKQDMAFARKQAQSGVGKVSATWHPSEEDIAAIDDILDPLRHRKFETFDAFETFLREFLTHDLVEVDKGNVFGPVKAASDVLRDLRDNFRLATEYRGLTSESHEVFAGEFVGTLNRIVFGPPRHRNEELMALLNAGVVALAGGPGAVTKVNTAHSMFEIETAFSGGIATRMADVLVLSRIDVFSPVDDSSMLMQDLLKKGLVRPFENGGFHPGGIDIDEMNQVIHVNGSSMPGFWAIGYLVEGAHYYTQELPRPGRFSRLTKDADLCVKKLFSLFSVHQEASQRPPATLNVAYAGHA